MAPHDLQGTGSYWTTWEGIRGGVWGVRRRECRGVEVDERRGATPRAHAVSYCLRSQRLPMQGPLLSCLAGGRPGGRRAQAAAGGGTRSGAKRRGERMARERAKARPALPPRLFCAVQATRTRVLEGQHARMPAPRPHRREAWTRVWAGRGRFEQGALSSPLRRRRASKRRSVPSTPHAARRATLTHTAPCILSLAPSPCTHAPACWPAP